MNYFERLRKSPNTTRTTCLVDEGAVEVLAAWHRTFEGIVLESVEVVIKGRGIDILPSLKQNQYDAICEEINSTI